MSSYKLSRDMTKPAKCHVRPTKTQIILSIGPVWPESSLSAWRNHGSLATHWAHSEESDPGRTLILLILSRLSSILFFFFLFFRSIASEQDEINKLCTWRLNVQLFCFEINHHSVQISYWCLYKMTVNFIYGCNGHVRSTSFRDFLIDLFI